MKEIVFALSLLVMTTSAPAFASTPHASSQGATLPGGGILKTGETLQSPNGAFYLTTQTDGNLCVRYQHDGASIWCSRLTAATGQGFSTAMQTDGNLCTYGSAGMAWCLTDKARNDGPFFLAMQDDANLCIYRGTAPNANGPSVWCSKAVARPYGASLVYGDDYHLQNGYQSWSGGYLDTRAAGCSDNVLCVSTSSRPNRDTNSGSWVILSADGKKVGEPVASGDHVYLANKYPRNFSGASDLIPYKFGGYLDTRGSRCQNRGNFLCVSTAWTPNRDSDSGTWTIAANSGDNGRLMQYQAVTLFNNYSDNGGYLDTRGRSCEENLLCVSTSKARNRDSGSGLWRLSGH